MIIDEFPYDPLEYCDSDQDGVEDCIDGCPLDANKIAELTEEYRRKFANPFIAGHRGYIDDVIMPRNSRKRICRSLAMLRNKKLENPWRRHAAT